MSAPIADALPLLHPYANHLNMHPVSTAVNSPRDQGEELIAQMEYSPEREARDEQLRLI